MEDSPILVDMRTVNRTIHESLAGFHQPVREWFTHSFPEPTRVQQLGWPVLQTSESTLILAPTGSGKTLAAFLTAIDRVMFEPVPDPLERCRVLYISPLKALAVDVDRNLRAPVIGVTRYAERSNHPVHTPTIAVRTGDTPSKERAQFLKTPSDILITTPESLYLLLTSNSRERLRSVRWVIIDEIHAMVGTKRGAHLALSLERLEEIAQPHGFQRIGLSATQRPLDEVARFLGGYERSTKPSHEANGLADPATVLSAALAEAANPIANGMTPDTEPNDDWTGPDHNEIAALDGPPMPLLVSRRERPVRIVDAGSGKEWDILVEVPVEDMARLSEIKEIPSGEASMPDSRSSIWPAIHPMILNLIKTHRSTLIFVNSRRLAERLSAALNELAGEELVHAHHGSVAREQRLMIENQLKSGQLPAMVATSSLELGIDMGAIDLVIQVEAPNSISSAIQRIGRAGHQVGAASKGIIIPKFRGDLLACAALTERMQHGAVEHMRYIRNPLDILAQQIVAMVSMDDWRVDDLESLIRSCASFAELPRSLFLQVLDMLSGRYPSDDYAELRPRLTWDRINNTLFGREGAKRIAISNGGTIPDRGLYGVFLLGAEKGRGRVGELDEEMVFETRVGEVFLLGASSWRVEEITHDRVIVTPAPGVPGKMPFWHGESVGRPVEFGKAIGALTRKLRELPHDNGVRVLMQEHALSKGAALNLLQYLQDQSAVTGVLPDDRTVVVESYRDEMGDWRVCILSAFGARVHAPWAMAIGALLRESSEAEVDILWTDDGIVIRLPDSDEPPPVDLFLPDPDEIEDLVIKQLGAGGGARQSGQGSPAVAMFASRFREAAARALLLPRRHPGKRAPLWQQRKRAAELLQATAQFGSFPIILETYRECLRDVFDMQALITLLRDLKSRQIRVETVTTQIPSPFAASLMFNYVANFIYEGDAPLAERRAQVLSVDPAQLRDLLGEVSLRELLDADTLDGIERNLQFLTPERAVKHADGLHDMLLRIGDLSTDEIRARCIGTENADHWIQQLSDERRIVRLTVASEHRWIAGEDTGRFRDALGIPPPSGLPDAFLEYMRDPMGDLIARFTRTHGPFQTTDIAQRFGLGTAAIGPTLTRLFSSGRLLQGEFRPGATGQEWCDSNVMRAVRQRSLALLRQEVEPVEPGALGRLSLEWQHIISPWRGRSAVLNAIEQLQAASIPASVLEERVLGSRVANFDSRELDLLMASGQIMWVGCESLGQHDGRVSLFLTEHAPYLIKETPVEQQPHDPAHVAIRTFLSERGASFYPQILAKVGGFPPDVLNALWDLVWSGEVTNDTMQPLRAYCRSQSTSKRIDIRSRGRSTMVPVRSRPGQRPGMVGAARATEPTASGRWYLVSDFLAGDVSLTERMSAYTSLLLDRYGVLTREAVQSEGIEGGFSAIYGILKAMEESGVVRRGYFVAGLGATQFALSSAVDRLRDLRDPQEELRTVILAATDPANPYGTVLPIREPSGGRKPMRQAGSVVILVEGVLAAWMPKSERQLILYPDCLPEISAERIMDTVAESLSGELLSGRRSAMTIDEVNGVPTHESPMAASLIDTGFVPSSVGYIKRLGRK